MKKYSAEEDPVTLSGYQFIFGGAAMILIGLAIGGKLGGVSGAATLVILYLGFLSAAAYSLWGVLLRYNPVSRVAVFTFTTPLFGVLISAMVPSERSGIYTLANLAALILVSAGAYIVNTKTDEK